MSLSVASKQKEWTKAERDMWWENERRRYISRNEVMLHRKGWEWVDPLAFYREIFPDGFLQERWSDEHRVEYDGKPNAIALQFGPETVTDKRRDGSEVEKPRVRRYTVTDDLDDVPEIVTRSYEGNAPVYMAPVSWFGKKNQKQNARFLHALVVDLDNVSPSNLKNLMKQIENGRDPNLPKVVSLPQPTFVVNSGTGMHLYYVLDKPVPLVPRMLPFLSELKRRLTDVVWTDFTSELGEEGRQYQGIYQGFRMPGTVTKLTGYGELGKQESKYEAVAFGYTGPGYEFQRCSIDYLVDYCGIRGDGIPAELRNVLVGSWTPLAEARERWPEWYERRVVKGEKSGHWVNNRALYDWWLKKAGQQARYHGRYHAIIALVAYAMKCDVPYEDLERDAYALVPVLDELTEEPDNHFTEYDVECALSAYGDEELIEWKPETISRKTKIPIPKNKRNGRNRDQHVKVMNAVRDALDPDGSWRNKNGAPTKRDEILAYAAEHPEASHSEIARALGMSRTTVVKWLKEDCAEVASGLPCAKYFQSKAFAGEEAGGQASIEGIIGAITGYRSGE